MKTITHTHIPKHNTYTIMVIKMRYTKFWQGRGIKGYYILNQYNCLENKLLALSTEIEAKYTLK